jgi:hypothetical protein
MIAEAEVVVLLHADGQYAPEEIPRLMYNTCPESVIRMDLVVCGVLCSASSGSTEPT